MATKDLRDSYFYHRQRNRRLPASAALVRAREDVAAAKRRYPHSCDPARIYGGSWQSLDTMPRHASLSSRAYYVDKWPDGWRNLGNVGEIRLDSCYRGRPVEHTGWYTDDHGDTGTLAGYVLQLPARHGKPVYIPGTAHSEWDGVTLYPLDRYDDIAECARAADHYAEHAAERERDYQRAWQAGQDASECNIRAAEIRREIMQVCSDLRAASRRIRADYYVRRLGTHADTFDRVCCEAINRLCAIARDRVKSLLTDLYQERRRRDKLRDEYGSEDAFAEGYDG